MALVNRQLLEYILLLFDMIFDHNDDGLQLQDQFFWSWLFDVGIKQHFYGKLD